MAIGRALPAAPTGPPPRRFSILRAASIACLLVGVLLLVTFAYGMWHGFDEQQQLNHEWQQQAAAPYTAPKGLNRALQKPVNGIDFAIRIPRLKYFAAVREGVDTSVLYSGPGHYPGTVWPGDQGTVGVAAHNVYWINFPQLSPRDEIDIQTRYGTFKYHVTGSRVVDPSDRTVVVSSAAGYHLVLTTCWPLWAGAFATQRFVIFAQQFYPRIVTPTYN
jgi:LPXTG-site transpeptidase (sortase) family protein